MNDLINLCLNCLEPGASAVPVGPDRGSQRDPYRDTVQLCELCENALRNGHFMTLSHRYRLTRQIIRGGEDE